MRKKKRPRRRQGPPKPTVPARFAVGDRVRVKPGITDPDFDDIPLGGWAGTVRDVDRRSQPLTYQIEWNQHTLDQMHPVFLKRSERDDFDIEYLWLSEADLEPDTGEPAVIEQPTAIRTRPLRTDDPDDRIRAIFGLTSDDPPPVATEENLRRYHRFLADHLTLPFQAKVEVETGPLQETEYTVTVTDLLDAGDVEEGLYCDVVHQGRVAELPLVALEVTDDLVDRQLVEDFSYWFTNWQADDAGAWDARVPYLVDPHQVGPSGKVFVKSLLRYGLYGTAYGVVLGALLSAVEGTRTGAWVGASLVGIIGGLTGAHYGMLVAKANRLNYGRLPGGLLGTALGAAAGALIGALAVAFVGSVGGGILGALAARLMRRRASDSLTGAVLGAAAGAVSWAVYLDREAALAGALQGAWMGTGVAGSVVLVASVLLTLTAWLEGRRGER